MSACSLCHQDRASLAEIRNNHGRPVGIVCEQCHPKARAIVNRVAGLCGAHVVDGRLMSSPIGSPDYRTLEEARGWIEERVKKKPDNPTKGLRCR